jgi:hypothetical protein
VHRKNPISAILYAHQDLIIAHITAQDCYFIAKTQVLLCKNRLSSGGRPEGSKRNLNFQTATWHHLKHFQRKAEGDQPVISVGAASFDQGEPAPMLVP